jgi:hypothetical protein
MYILTVRVYRPGPDANHDYQCCPTSTNCTESLLKKPSCANETWDLYNNGGYFCCERGFTGYSAEESDGCAEPGYALKAGQVSLPILSTGQGEFFSSLLIEELGLTNDLTK